MRSYTQMYFKIIHVGKTIIQRIGEKPKIDAGIFYGSNCTYDGI